MDPAFEGELKTRQDIERAVLHTKPDETGKKRLLIKKSIDIGCPDVIPDDWEVELDNGRQDG